MFLNKKNIDKQEMGFNQDALALRIANRIIGIQASLANYLNSKTAHFSQNQKKGILICICAVFGGLSLYFIIKSIN